ncbi:MAG: hypothetical protein MZV65_00265 [Chromatiales bacterium]|nr:hypothetical protein [Chromatiales bacterium]
MPDGQDEDEKVCGFTVSGGFSHCGCECFLTVRCMEWKGPCTGGGDRRRPVAGVLEVTANITDGEILSIEMMGPGSKLVVDEDVASSSFTWAPGQGCGRFVPV